MVRRRRSTACHAEGHRGRVASAEGARDADVWAKPGAGEAVLARAQHVAGLWRHRRMASPRRERKQRRERYSNGRLVINSKFQSSVCKFNFSPCSRGQTKNFLIRKLFKTSNATTFVSGTNSFEASFER